MPWFAHRQNAQPHIPNPLLHTVDIDIHGRQAGIYRTIHVNLAQAGIRSITTTAAPKKPITNNNSGDAAHKTSNTVVRFDGGVHPALYRIATISGERTKHKSRSSPIQLATSAIQIACLRPFRKTTNHQIGQSRAPARANQPRRQRTISPIRPSNPMKIEEKEERRKRRFIIMKPPRGFKTVKTFAVSVHLAADAIILIYGPWTPQHTQTLFYTRPT